jgi:hypothetical protein
VVVEATFGVSFCEFLDLARSLLIILHRVGPGDTVMYDRDFFTSKLGLAALVSIAAMVTFNVYALTHQYGMTTEQLVVAAPSVELA